MSSSPSSVDPILLTSAIFSPPKSPPGNSSIKLVTSLDSRLPNFSVTKASINPEMLFGLFTFTHLSCPTNSVATTFCSSSPTDSTMSSTFESNNPKINCHSTSAVPHNIRRISYFHGFISRKRKYPVLYETKPFITSTDFVSPIYISSFSTLPTPKPY
jgi:hypothetical protein